MLFLNMDSTKKIEQHLIDVTCRNSSYGPQSHVFFFPSPFFFLHIWCLVVFLNNIDKKTILAYVTIIKYLMLAIFKKEILTYTDQNSRFKDNIVFQ